MTDTPRSRSPKGAPGPTREDRLKAALKANMARRKAQAKARAGAADETTSGRDDGRPQNDE